MNEPSSENQTSPSSSQPASAARKTTFAMAALAVMAGLVVALLGLHYGEETFKLTGLMMVLGGAGVGALTRPKS